jgi:undecaprenyl-diphosphatase
MKILQGKHTYIIGAMAAAVIIISVFAYLFPRFPGDLRLALFAQSVGGDGTESFMRWVSFLFGGAGAVSLIVVSAILVWRRIGIKGALIVSISGVSTLFNEALKVLVGRSRPTEELVRVMVDERNASFPSGHSCLAVVILGILGYLIMERIQNKVFRRLFLALITAVILLVGVSRVYLGAHWPSDVIGGYLVGGLLLVFLIRLYNVLKGV